MWRKRVTIMTVAPLRGFARGPFAARNPAHLSKFAFSGGLIRLKVGGPTATARRSASTFPRPSPLDSAPFPAEAPMRFSPSMFCLAIIAGCLSSTHANAQEVSDLSARMSARRDLELAKMELRHYWQVDYPRQRRHLNAAIELTELEIRGYEERLREWGPFSRFSTGDAFWLTIQETRMCLREAQLRLRDLWAERNALVRFHSDQWRELEFQVHQARLRVAALEPDDEPNNDAAASPVADRPAI
jgi:hypothetical protein